MPVVNEIAYQPPWLLRQKHIHTIYPALFRKLVPVIYDRERIALPDGDFLDLDWKKGGNPKLAILLHGLEGNSQATYIRGMARLFRSRGYDVLAVNFRGCSGVANHLFRSYHSGATEDVDAVVQHVLLKERYEAIVMAGFSLGGNMLLKYLGEQGSHLPKPIEAAFAFSVPCHLQSAANTIGKLYTKVFLNTLVPKLEEKLKKFPNSLDSKQLRGIKTIQDFDDIYTGPVHGFKGAADYYHRCSSLYFLEGIAIPTLLLNALDDPFLAPDCHPFEKAKKLDKLYFLAPKHGGHVGFVQFNATGTYWAEEQVSRFLTEVIPVK